MSEPIERRVPPPFTWQDMDTHMDTKLKPIHAKLDTLLEKMESAVPDGDFEGHRKAHEHWLEEVAERKALWAKVKVALIEKSLWTLLLAVVAVGWYWLQGHIK